MSATVVTIFAKKGGVGKTCLTQNLAAYFAMQGKRVLCIDLDEQGNLTQFFLGETKFQQLHPLNTVSAVLNPELDHEASQVIQATNNPNISIAAASTHLRQFLLPEQSWNDEISFSLRDFVDDVGQGFDFVFCDTPPAVDTLPTWAALLAAHYALSPVEPERNSAQSLVGGQFRLVAARDANPRLNFLGYVVNLRKGRRILHDRYEKALRDLHGPLVFDTVLRDLAAFPESEALSQSVLAYEPKSPAADLMRGLGAEVTTKMERHQFQKQTEQTKRKVG